MSFEYRCKFNKVVAGNAVARKLILYLTHSSICGEELLDVLQNAGIIAVRIEHLYNALRQNDKEFIRYVYLIAENINRDDVIKAKTLSDFLNIVKEIDSK